MSDQEQILGDLLIKTSRTFALSIPVLPEPTRRDVTVAYLLFRIADTLEDATRWTPDVKLVELAAFADVLRSPDATKADELRSRWLADPPLKHDAYMELLGRTPLVVKALQAMDPAAAEVVSKHTIRTIRRMAGFVGRSESSAELRLENLEDLADYCYAVAGIVGEMLTELFLLRHPRLESAAEALRSQAARFGEALQLVNILKDSATDAEEGRRYLPAGVATSDVFSMARFDLDGAEEYVRSLQTVDAPRGVVGFTALPVLLARRTLDRVERDGPGAKLTRPEVAAIVRDLELALDSNAPAVPAPSGTREPLRG